MTDEIYISTVLLEKNRWSSKEPSLLVSDWLDKIEIAGFNGMELWENHLLKADKAELQRVQNSPVSVNVLNTYCGFEDEKSEQRKLSAELAHQVNAKAVKFNFGNNADLEKNYIENLLKWKEILPQDCRLLCECHPYTILEDVEEAARVLNPLSDYVEIIIHAFNGSQENFKKRLDIFSAPTTHVHVAGSGVKGITYSPLEGEPIVRSLVKTLKENHFNGSWTIEFCNGVASKNEDIDAIFNAAVNDFKTLKRELKCYP